jgi:hypothetical protein
MNDVSAYVPSAPPAWVKSFAKIGLIAKGIVYCIVGVLAFMAAFNIGGGTAQAADKKGVFQTILEQPFGKFLLALVSIGLFFYALWRIFQALKDTENKGNGLKGLSRRGSYLFSGAVYGALAFYAAKLVMGSHQSQGSDSRQTLAQKLLEQPFGAWLAGAVAIGIILTGLNQIYRGWSGKYKKKVQSAGLKHETEAVLIRAGKFGYVARGIVWIIIGYLFLQAALHANPKEAGGTGRAFQFLEEASYGPFLLGAVAVGLFCYGVFMFMRAKYQPIHTS